MSEQFWFRTQSIRIPPISAMSEAVDFSGSAFQVKSSELLSKNFILFNALQNKNLLRTYF
jgi:hypothetical protein